jgi:hypothetical protein
VDADNPQPPAPATNQRLWPALFAFGPGVIGYLGPLPIPLPPWFRWTAAITLAIAGLFVYFVVVRRAARILVLVGMILTVLLLGAEAGYAIQAAPGWKTPVSHHTTGPDLTPSHSASPSPSVSTPPPPPDVAITSPLSNDPVPACFPVIGKGTIPDGKMLLVVADVSTGVFFLEAQGVQDPKDPTTWTAAPIQVGSPEDPPGGTAQLMIVLVDKDFGEWLEKSDVMGGPAVPNTARPRGELLAVVGADPPGRVGNTVPVVRKKDDGSCARYTK